MSSAHPSKVKIFSCTQSKDLAEKIAKSYGLELGNVIISRYSDGEFQPSFEESLRGSRVFIIGSTFPSSENLMEMLLMLDAAKRASASHINAVIPYFGWARQDRKDKPRVPIAAKLMANILEAAGANRIKIGRASCRERVWISGGGGSAKKKGRGEQRREEGYRDRDRGCR